MILDYLAGIFIHHRTRSVIWEITHNCNCKCQMCDLWCNKNQPFLPLDKAKKLVDYMYDNGVIFLQITGGEPTLYKDLIPLIKYIVSKNFLLNLATNGTTITEKSAKELKNAGLEYINISFDYFNSEVQDKIRGYKGEFDKAVAAVKILKNAGLTVYSSTMINSYNWNKMDKLAIFLNKKLGIPLGLCFPYPGFSSVSKDNPSYLTKEQLLSALNDVLKLKSKGFKIINTKAFIDECIRFVKGEKMQYPCLAGKDVFGLRIDKLNACWILADSFDTNKKLAGKEIDCNKCNLVCFRELSIVTAMLKTKPWLFLQEVFRIVLKF